MIKNKNKINERRSSKNYKSIFVTDIDETLLHSNFDSLGPTKWPDAQIQYATITNATPNLPILQVMDEYINDGYDVAFLTARSSYKTTIKAIKKFLMYRDIDGNLQPIDDVLEDDFSFAVNDNEQHSYIAEATPDRKAEIVAQLCELYDDVVFADDSNSNLASVKKLTRIYKNLTVIDAKGESKISKKRSIKESTDLFGKTINKLVDGIKDEVEKNIVLEYDNRTDRYESNEIAINYSIYGEAFGINDQEMMLDTIADYIADAFGVSFAEWVNVGKNDFLYTLITDKATWHISCEVIDTEVNFISYCIKADFDKPKLMPGKMFI